MTRILSIDCESDGLYGPIWAVGAVVWDTEINGTVGSFAEMVADPVGSGAVIDPWVIENVVPHVDLRSVKRQVTLLADFARFYLQQRKVETVVIADFGTPVEARLFRDLEHQGWNGTFDGPYPLHELGTMLLAAGVDPDVSRTEFSGMTNLVPHNPVDDATASLHCWLKAQKILEAAAARPPYHLIQFDDDGWAIQHPSSDGPDLLACPYSEVARRQFTAPPAALGRFRVELDGDRINIRERA